MLCANLTLVVTCNVYYLGAIPWVFVTYTSGAALGFAFLYVFEFGPHQIYERYLPRNQEVEIHKQLYYEVNVVVARYRLVCRDVNVLIRGAS